METFAAEHWERKPLHVRRDEPAYYSDLLTLDTLDSLLSTLTVRSNESIQVVSDGKEVPISKLGPPRRESNRQASGLEELYQQYRNGATIVLNSFDEHSGPLRRFCDTLTEESGFGSQVNLYLTPAGSQGFKAHYDTHDVFIAQIHGSKHWRLYGSPIELPLYTQPYPKGREPGEPEQEIDLAAGDLLYLPRGYVHDATSNEPASVHLTIGVHPTLWAAVFLDAVSALIEEDGRFHRALPFGYTESYVLRRNAEEVAEDLLDMLRAQLSARSMVAKTAREAILNKRPALRHHLTDLEAVGSVGLRTRVRRRPELCSVMTADGEALHLEFHGKVVRLPLRVADELKFVVEDGGDGFTAADIPGNLDEVGRLVLIRSLVREGFLTLS